MLLKVGWASARFWLAGCVTATTLLCVATGQIPDQYPKPLVHTTTDHPATRVILLSVNGMHAVDLANWVAGHPLGALAALSRRGVTYTNAHTAVSAPAAGLISMVTGGTPISTGIVSDDGYDRTLAPPGSTCAKIGTPIQLQGQMEAKGGSGLDPLQYPRDPIHGCNPVAPHVLVRVNTMFEVVHVKIGPTAWFGENATITDMLKGPSGEGLDDSCSAAHPDKAAATSQAAHDADEAGVSSMLAWMDGQSCNGKLNFHIPALFGMSFISVAVAQAARDQSYVVADGTPSSELAESLAYVDEAIGRMVTKLKDKKLFDSTWIFVTAPYGQSPMDPSRVHHIAVGDLRSTAEAVKAGVVAHMSGGDVAMLWLSDTLQVNTVVKAYRRRARALGIADIYAGARLALTLTSSQKDGRMPDIVLEPEMGVLWGDSHDSRAAAYGGISDEDTHVALLVSGAQLTGRTDPTWVPTTQLAPLLLRSLGMEKFDLDALHMEHTPALPGIF